MEVSTSLESNPLPLLSFTFIEPFPYIKQMLTMSLDDGDQQDKEDGSCIKSSGDEGIFPQEEVSRVLDGP